MKRLWKYIPPCLSDVMGFQAVMNTTDGLGIIDDPGSYKPLGIMGVGQNGGMAFGAGGRGGRPGGRPDFGGHVGPGGPGGRPDFGGHGGPEGFGSRGPGGRPGFGGERGGRGGGKGNGMGMIIGDQRVSDSGLRNEDIISGTERKLVQTFENSKRIDPKFVLLCNAPSSAMISSDLETAADKISASGGTPATNVKIYGDKDYLYGASLTFETIGKLLMESAPRKERAVNIIGCHIIDWSEETTDAFTKVIEAQGIEVLSKWGAKGLNTETIRKAAQASLNLVVNISGLRLAQYMESEFGIPYIACAPFGKEQLDELLGKMNEMIADPHAESCVLGLEGSEDHSADYDAVVIGEQLLCNALRRVLKTRGHSNVRVLSFFDMDKSCMEPGDKKIQSEDELAELTLPDTLKLIAANPDYRPAVKNNVNWIDLPNSGMAVVTRIAQINMIGGALEDWLKLNI